MSSPKERLRAATVANLIVFAALSALLLSAAPSRANVCVDRKISPLHHICGIVIDSTGIPIPHANLKILKGATEVVAAETGESGWFSFDKLAAGSYEIEVEANGFGIVRYAIVVRKATTQCKKMLQVQLATGVDTCSHIQIVKHPHFE